METLRRLGGAFWPLAIGVVALFAFFVAMGGITPADAVGITVAVVVLAALFAVHALRVRRELHEHGHEELAHDLHRIRERRGF
jgi:uncharacterized membrane protein YhaH (DUF805 family)